MTSDFGSLPLAQLYEKQGYIDDALEIYRAMDTSQNEDVRDAVSLLEAQKEAADNSRDRTNGAQMAHLLEVWVRLIVMRKRTDIFKAIRARL